MNKRVFTKKQRAVLDYFVENFTTNPASFNTAICENCQMYSFDFEGKEESADALFNYFVASLQAINLLRSVVEWKFGSFRVVRNFLDFASGFGRLTRFLVQETNPEKIWISEIQEKAVQFQKDEFGVHGILSSYDPYDFHLPVSCDVIFVASLFTHLPEKRFFEWLEILSRSLDENGILIFTVHDIAVSPFIDLDEKGFSYNPEVREIPQLESKEYGSTHVNESFMAKAIETRVGGDCRYYRIPQGLWNHDVYILEKKPSPNEPDIGIIGPKYPLIMRKGKLHAWFHETRRGSNIAAVDILQAGRTIMTCASLGGSPGTMAFYGDNRFLPKNWSIPLVLCAEGLSATGYEEGLILKVKSDLGRERLFPVHLLEEWWAD